jgi:hypothetical protein
VHRATQISFAVLHMSMNEHTGSQVLILGLKINFSE